MALRIYNVDLSPESIDKCINNLKNYRDDLDRRLQEFVDALAEVGLESISSTIQQINPDELDQGYGQLLMNKKLKRSGYGIVRMEISLSGSDVLFIEFSAGITFGTDSYPLPSGDGYGMGTYPDGKGHWDDPEGWWYRDEAGELHHSYGNRAYMPMYHATEAIAIQVWFIAMKTFGV